MSKTDGKDESVKSGKVSLYDVIIVGSGPAGYTAGIYTSRARLKTLLVTGNLPGRSADDY